MRIRRIEIEAGAEVRRHARVCLETEGGVNGTRASTEFPMVEVVIEVPRGSFLKRGPAGKLDFVSPLPCPYNYGSVPSHVGREGDLLDALVLGPRLSYGMRIRVRAWGAVILTDRGMSDDKLICGVRRPDAAQRRRILRFFGFYAWCKGWLNTWRHQPGRNACEGWCDALQAIQRARPRDDTWQSSLPDS